MALLAGLRPSVAQTPQPPTGPPQAEVLVQESGFIVHSQVDLVSVPVVVRDSHGRAIGGLSREDFRISDNGKPQTVSKFSVEKFGATATEAAGGKVPTARDEPAQPPMPERFVAFFFDDLNTEFSDLVNAREAAWRYMQNVMVPSERAAIATASGLTTLDFTNDRDKLHQTLLAIHPQEGIVHGVDCPPMTLYEADLIANSNDSMALGTAVADYIDCSNSTTPPDEAAFSVFNFAKMHVELVDRSIRRAFDSLDALIRKMNTMAGRRIVVMASSGFQMLDNRRQDELDIMEQAIRSGVVVNTLDARALHTGVFGSAGAGERIVSATQLEMRGFIGGVSAGTHQKPDGNTTVSSYSGSRTETTRAAYAREEALAKRALLAEVASATGGHFFENSNDLDAGFARLAGAPEYLYVLGFNPQDLTPDGKFHSLKVTLKDSHGVSVEARNGYYAPPPRAAPGQQAYEGIEEALFSRGEIADIPVIVQTHVSKPSAGKAALAVAAKVDLRKVSFRKEQGINHANVTVVTGIFDNDGNYVSGIRKVFELHLRDETFKTYSALTVRNSFDLTPGTYLVRLVVRDAGSQVMASKNTTAAVP